MHGPTPEMRMSMNSPRSPETDTENDEGLTFSIRFIYEYIFRSWREISIAAIILILGATAYAYVSDKQYSISGTITQTDLSDVVQPSVGGSLSLALLSNATKQSQPISDYLIMITSPEIDGELMRHPEFISILFNTAYTQDPKRPGTWIHKSSMGFLVKQMFCNLFSISCPATLTPVQVGVAVDKKLTISPTAMPDQGVLSPIGASSSYDISFVGKDPANALRLLQFLHDATNHAIQQKDIVFAANVERSLTQRIQHIDSNDAREQMITVLSDQERKLAILTAAKIDYAARWVVAPTVSSWPAKPNLPLLYAVAVLGSIFAGCLVRFFILRMTTQNPGTRLRTSKADDRVLLPR